MHLFEKENDIVLKKSTKCIKVHAKNKKFRFKTRLNVYICEICKRILF